MKVEIQLDLAQLELYILLLRWPVLIILIAGSTPSHSDKQKRCMQQFKKFVQISKHLLLFIRSLQSMYSWSQNEYWRATSDHFPIQNKQGWKFKLTF